MLSKIKHYFRAEQRQKFWQTFLGTKYLHPPDYYIVAWWVLSFYFGARYLYRHYIQQDEESKE